MQDSDGNMMISVQDIRRISVAENEVLLIKLPDHFSVTQVTNFVKAMRQAMNGLNAKVMLYHGDIVFEKIGFDEVK